ASRRPVNAAVNVYPITRIGFHVEVNGLAGPNAAAAEALIEQAADDYLRDVEPVILGLSVLPRRDRATLAAISGVIDETASAQGATVASVRLALAVDPGTNVLAHQLQKGELAKLFSIAFT